MFFNVAYVSDNKLPLYPYPYPEACNGPCLINCLLTGELQPLYGCTPPELFVKAKKCIVHSSKNMTCSHMSPVQFFQLKPVNKIQEHASEILGK